MNWRSLKDLGEPSISLGAFKLWVHGQQFPAAADYWDGNWLRVTACCSSSTAIACTEGPIVHLGEILGLLRGVEKLYESLAGEAALECMEPNVSVKLESQTNGSITVSSVITPDQMPERHSFEEQLDQSYLPSLIAQCQALLATYPLREAESLPPDNGT